MNRSWYKDVYLNSSHWKEKREEVLKRDNFSCQRCGNVQEFYIETYAKYFSWEGKSWVISFLEDFSTTIISAGLPWNKYYIATQEDETTSIEWHLDPRELHFLLREDFPPEYIKVWGTNIEHEMETGILLPSLYIPCYQWLLEISS